MDRSLSTGTRLPGKKSSLHYPADHEIPQIVPSHSTRSGNQQQEVAGKGASSSAGAGAVSAGEVPDSHYNRAIDVDALSDDSTPAGLSTYIDFTSVFGNDRGAHGKEKGSDDYVEYGSDEDDDGQGKNKKKHRWKAPEQRITIFALRLALIEKAASMIGTMAFLWATVVILGGFATTISFEDFWVVTVIIVAEGSRIFSRSRELEWENLSSKSISIIGQKILHAAHSVGSKSYPYRGPLQKLKMRLDGKKTKRNLSSGQGGGPLVGTSGEARSPPSSTSTHYGQQRRGASIMPDTPKAQASEDSEAKKRTWSSSSLPLVPYMNHMLTTRVVSRILYIEQVMSAFVCIALALWRLLRLPESEPRISLSLYLFYSLAMIEAGLFLLEKCYAEYRIRYGNLLDSVREDVHLGIENLHTVKQFFNDVYAQCLKGSVFDGLEMDLVSFSIDWLQSDDHKQRLGGAKLLNGLVTMNNKPRPGPFAADALRRLGTTPGIIERLVEMLSWNALHEGELVHEIADIMCRLVAYNRNCSRLVAVPGSLDGLVSLLLTHMNVGKSPGTDISRNNQNSTGNLNPQPPYPLWLKGLKILKHLCKDHKNSVKIGEARGLLSILVLFIEVRDTSSFTTARELESGSLKNGKLKTYKKSLQVLGTLAGATNTSGGLLRKRIASIVSGLKNLRDMIEYGDDNPQLQRLSVQIIYHLALEDDVKTIIGATGGLIRILFNLFAKYEAPEAAGEDRKKKKIRLERSLASVMAGDALTILVLQNEKNCIKMLNLKDAQTGAKPFLKVMVESLSKPDEIASSAAQILRSVVRYANESEQSVVATDSVPAVLGEMSSASRRRGQVSTSKSEKYEAFLGLASRVLECLGVEEYKDALTRMDKLDIVTQLIKNLKHTPTTNKHPRIRRYSVELILGLIAKDDSFLDAFQKIKFDLKRVLERTLDSISEVENFCLFSGLVGYTRHREEMEHLVERAIAAVDNYNCRSLQQQQQQQQP